MKKASDHDMSGTMPRLCEIPEIEKLVVSAAGMCIVLTNTLNMAMSMNP